MQSITRNNSNLKIVIRVIENIEYLDQKKFSTSKNP